MADTVCLAYLHTDDVSHSWHVSYLNSVLFDCRPDGPMHLRGGYLAQYGTDMSYDHARNKVAKAFLDEKDADWLWWVDSDMGWDYDALERLIAAADPVERPIVGGLCFGVKPVGDDGLNGPLFRPFPTIYSLDERDDSAGFSPIYAYPVNELIQVGGTGSAFVLVHRSVLEGVRAKFGDTWYDRIPHPKNDVPFGEDLSFCLRAINAGFPIHAHTGIRTSHHKFHHVSEPYYWSQMVAPPADEPVTVIVPVVDRPQNAEPFMRSLHASTGLATVIAVTEADDVETQDAWLKAGAGLVLSTDVKSFADKVNEAVQHVNTSRLFIVGDDVRFHRGWYDEALQVAKSQRCDVVGTNDLFNPRVLAGEHATHMLISTDYVLEQGASWDGPGKVCHGGYRHWFVDDEIVTVAKQRNTFTVALGSIVEHLHPLAGKADDDEVYRKGQRHAEKDKVLFFTRRAQHAQGVAA